MFLKTVELTGFKSFPSKTSITFERGITAIIGPNGSGKSNISDAIRWVFGETSSKAMRGSKMEDVIFGGTKEVRPSSFARVSLVIDNSDNLVDCDFSEIKITRQLARSGESGYFINDRSVRLKDIYELFLNTGVGREGYSIIGQGKIAELISRRSEDRRGIFEEASGISKYRYKKSEAEKKLSNVEDNLTRIKDIVYGLGERLETLGPEAEKAKKYIELYERKKSLEIYTWVDSAEKIKREFEKLISGCEISKFNYENADSEFIRLNEKTDNLYNKIQEINLLYENRKNENHRIANNIVTKNSDIEILKNNISKIRDNIEFNLYEFNRNKSDIEILDRDIADKTIIIDRISSEYKSLELEIEDIVNYSEHIEFKLLEINNKIEEINNILSEINTEINELKIKISEKNSEIRHISERKEILSREIGKIGDIREKNKKELGILNSLKKSALTEKEKSELKLAETENKIKDLVNSEKSKRKELDSLYLKSERNENTIQTLTHIYENLEGYPDSVKSVIKRGLKGVNGTIAQLIETDEKYSEAIEVALGQNLQNIIVDDENSAKEAIRYLKTNNLGRATFYPRNIIKGRFIEREKLDYLCRNNKASGFIDAGSELVSCEQKYINIIKYLLGRTIICDNINNAAKIAERLNYMYKIVTLDGQVINAGGSFTGGSTARKSSMLSNKNKIENLKNQNIEHAKNQKEISGQIEKIAGYINRLNKEYDLQKEELNSKILDLYNLDSDIKLKISEVELGESQINSAENEIRENAGNLVRETKKELEGKLSEYGRKFGENTRILDELKNQAKKTSGEKDAVLIKINEQRLVLSGVLNNINIETERLENLNRERVNLKNKNARLSDDNKEKNSELISGENKIEAEKKEIEELTKTAGRIALELLEYEKGRTNLEKENAETKNNIKDKAAERDALFREHTRLESMRSEKEKEHDSIINKLWEEYNLTFSDAKEMVLTSLETSQITVITENPGNIAKELSKIKSGIKELGTVNVNAVEEFKEVSRKYDFLSGQSSDLRDSIESLQKIIDNLETEMKKVFSESMNQINQNFGEVFSELFGGGTAGIIYTDPDNVLESELEIEVRPPGKNIKHISLLSGGEQTFVAIALYFALLKINPAPFCVLDEIESALDEVNVDRFAGYLKRYASQTQFILISHRRGTMEAANRLYGITMQDKGVSKYLALDINEAEKRLGKI
ncbi:MAG: chromosome segregation protein SMC [Oscillospiraceae bacterium]|nr:chromosome segregation protein SMC [Oscillospiraceae bacterium]